MPGAGCAGGRMQMLFLFFAYSFVRFVRLRGRTVDGRFLDESSLTLIGPWRPPARILPRRAARACRAPAEAPASAPAENGLKERKA